MTASIKIVWRVKHFEMVSFFFGPLISTHLNEEFDCKILNNSVHNKYVIYQLQKPILLA